MDVYDNSGKVIAFVFEKEIQMVSSQKDPDTVIFRRNIIKDLPHTLKLLLYNVV